MSDTPENRLSAAGLSLPPIEGPDYDYEPIKREGNILYLAGTLGKENGAVQTLGKVGAEVDEIEASRQIGRHYYLVPLLESQLPAVGSSRQAVET